MRDTQASSKHSSTQPKSIYMLKSKSVRKKKSSINKCNTYFQTFAQTSGQGQQKLKAQLASENSLNSIQPSL